MKFVYYLYGSKNKRVKKKIAAWYALLNTPYRWKCLIRADVSETGQHGGFPALIDKNMFQRHYLNDWYV